MKPAIVVEDLGKMYRLGKKQPSVINLSERISNGFRSLKNKLSRNDEAYNEFWALKDINFCINHGEVVGIIGRNGAGKSTLLKVLSRIVEPTTGKATVRGRLGSLLEVGTGFHPELTGRENIYLNGSILGMRRLEIQDQFSNIVDFSGISEFLDTPVKRYSSGMYVRLAFAVAAHLNPEILVIDEVLAVGDAAFQKQCLGKMREVSQAGRTVLFVSHNMSAVESLCTSCIELVQGNVKSIGNPKDIIQRYMASSQIEQSDLIDLKKHRNRKPGSKMLMETARLSSGGQDGVSFIQMGQPLTIAVSFDCKEESSLRPVVGVVIKDKYDVSMFGVNNRIIPGYVYSTAVSKGTISCHFDKMPLMPGSYSIDLYIGEEQTDQDLDIIFDAIRFDVEAADVFGSGKIPPPLCGNIFVPATFSLESQT